MDKTKKYKFLSFSNKTEQDEFVREKMSVILDLFKQCFMKYINDIEKIKTLVKGFTLEVDQKYFFVTYENELIGLCSVGKQNVITFDKDSVITPYQKIKNFEILNYEYYDRLFPVIFSLCKNPNYEHVGSFILSKVGKYYKKEFNISEIYLIPESSKFVNYFDENKKCDIINQDSYFKTNQKLINYYKKNNFTILKGIFTFQLCSLDRSEAIIYNVMRKLLK